MDNRMKGLLGYGLEAIGQTMSAVASTPPAVREKELSSQLDLWGNFLQGTGTALIVDSEEELPLARLGNHLQSIGNLVTIMGFLVPFGDGVRLELGKKGEVIETLGVSVSLPDDLKDGLTLESFFDIYGHFLQVIKINGVDEELVNIIAGWSQAIASILSLMSAIQTD